VVKNLGEKELNDYYLKLLDCSIPKEEFYKTCLKYFSILFSHDSIGYIEIDNAEIFYKVKDYSNSNIKKNYLTKLMSSLQDSEHPYNIAFIMNKPVLVNATEFSKHYKYFELYSYITHKNYYCIIPIMKEERRLALLSLDFESKEERDNFYEKFPSLEYHLKILNTLAYNVYIYHKANYKYLKYQNLHASGLTLNRLYLNNTEEILKMTLLSISGLIEANLFILLIHFPEENLVILHRLFKDTDQLDLKQLHFDSLSFTDVDTFLSLSEPTIFSKKEVSFSKDIGFIGRQIVALPTFELNQNRYTFLVGRNSRLAFSKDELEIISAYSEIVKLTILNSFMYHKMANQERLEKEVQIARDIQLNLLPRSIPILDNYQFGGFMIPAREIGGDYYDFMQAPNKEEVILAIGDVSGKGIPAGIVMATARTIIHSIIRKKISIGEIINELNAYLYFNYRNSMVLRFMSMTLLNLVVNENKLYFAGAGHGYILVYRKKSDSVENMLTGGMVLGIAPEVPSSLGEIQLNEGDAVLLYTDGVTEYTNFKNEPYEEERLMNSLKKHHEKDVQQMLISIYDDLKEFAGNSPQFDDITFLALKRTK
jgi:phosphoserine phosphatase RsbU/P